MLTVDGVIVSELGLNHWDSTTPSRLAADVARAEALGYTHALIGSNSLRLWDSYILLALAAQSTRQIRLAPFIDNPVLRHPTVIAGSIATVDHISQGRAELVLSVGGTSVRFAGRRPATIAQLERATVLTRQLLAGEHVEVGAERPAHLVHHRPVPVWLAATGPKSLRLAGRVADGVYLRVGRDSANLRAAIAAVHAGADEAGRDHGEIRIGLVLHTITSQRTDEIAAIARSLAAGYYEYSPSLFERAGIEWVGPDIGQLQEQVWPSFHHAADLVAAGEIVSFLPERAAAGFSLFGAPRDIAAQLRAAIEVIGRVDVVIPQPVTTPDSGSDFAQWFAQDVWPLV